MPNYRSFPKLSDSSYFSANGRERNNYGNKHLFLLIIILFQLVFQQLLLVLFHFSFSNILTFLLYFSLQNIFFINRFRLHFSFRLWILPWHSVTTQYSWVLLNRLLFYSYSSGFWTSTFTLLTLHFLEGNGTFTCVCFFSSLSTTAR